MIRFTDYGVIAEKPRIGHLPDFFRATCRKNYALDRKMIAHFRMFSPSSTTLQSSGEID